IPKDAVNLRSLTDCEVWKALHHNQDTMQRMKRFAAAVDGFVIDSSVKG
ncbi:N-(5'-phosphoribosyl)anthranilate isomerase, partial [Bacillus atrophaeus]|nr:N-(5'-phosphoribosyl)anthranilate isomerase [Bacillus atrophaeus]